MDYMVEFLDGRDRLIGEEEVMDRRNIPTLLDSVRVRMMYDPELMDNCQAIHISRVITHG